MRFGAVSALLLLTPLALAQQAPKAVSVEELRKSAEAKTIEIGKLAASGKLPSNDESLQLLQKLVAELAEIRERLRILEGAEAKDASLLAQARRIRWGGYLQYQYQDTDRKGTSQFDAFRYRRVRLGFDADIAPRLTGRVSFDLATGTNQTQEQLRDAFFTYDASGGSKLGRLKFIAGQMALPLGYELERSSADREITERSLYNQTLFQTERSRGIKVKEEGRIGSIQIGVFNALTINDPEQANLAPGVGDRLAVIGAAHLNIPNGSVGVSQYIGERAAYTANGATSPKLDRQFTYFDFEKRDLLLKGFTLRGELMLGKDRVPTATASASNVGHDMQAFHLMGVYRLSAADRIALRWEGWDTNLDRGNSALHGLGMAYIRDLTTAMRLTLGHEIFVDEQRQALGQTRYGATTIRLQVRL